MTVEWFSVAELLEAGLPGLPGTRRGLLNLVAREGWESRQGPDGSALSRPRKGRGGGSEYHASLLPEAARARLLTARPASPAAEPAESRESVWARFERLPDSLKVAARERLGVLQRVELMQKHGMRRGRAIDEVAAQAAREAKIAGERPAFSASTLYGWFGLVAGVAELDRLAYLAPAYAGRTEIADCDPAIWRAYKSDYLRPRRTFAAAYRFAAELAEKAGVALPSAKTLQRRLEREVSRLTIILLKEGEDALKREFPYIERDETTFHAMEAINVDGHKWDVLVDFGDGKPVRPMMVAIQDLYSRKMLGWRIARSENSNTVRMTFCDVFERFGIPRVCYFDNGRAFASKWMTGGTAQRFRFATKEEDQVGLLTQMGVDVRFTTPYSGQSKPIERSFRTLEGDIGTSAAFQGAYVGNNPLDKPHDANTRAIPIAEFEQVVAAGIRRHNAQLGRTNRACKAGGLSFDAAFEASLAQHGHKVPRPTPEQLRQAQLCVEGVMVRQNGQGIALAGNRYWADFLPEMVGQKVAARFDADDLHAGLHLYSLTGVYLGHARCLERVGFANLEEGRERLRLVKSAKKAAKQAAELQDLIATQDLAKLLPDLPDDEPAEAPRVVRGFFGNAALQIEEDAEMAAAEASFQRAAGRLRLVGDDEP